jgi:hypothetical protein
MIKTLHAQQAQRAKVKLEMIGTVTLQCTWTPTQTILSPGGSYQYVSKRHCYAMVFCIGHCYAIPSPRASVNTVRSTILIAIRIWNPTATDAGLGFVAISRAEIFTIRHLITIRVSLALTTATYTWKYFLRVVQALILAI